MADAVSPDSTPSDDSLDDVVAAVADGVPVNWAEAAARASTTANRDLLPHLQMLADLAAACNGSTRSESDSTATICGDSIAPFPPSFKDGRFVIGDFLGRGGFGVVHKAYDKERNAHVALKAFTRRGVESVYDFKNEFRVLAGLTHPNLVALYELFGDEQSWLIAMELVPGVDFVSYVRAGHQPVTPPGADPATPPACACDLTRLGNAMAQLYQA